MLMHEKTCVIPIVLNGHVQKHTHFFHPQNKSLFSENIDDLFEENQTENEAACKICLEERAGVMFLPCGHIPSCPLCAPALTR